jgi:single-strand DNA-binding protein
MLSLNHVTLAGHLTRDPEVRMVGTERSVADFAIAVNRRFKGQDGELKEDTTFVDCEAWGRTAEIVGQYLSKGSPAYLEGRLRLDSWQAKDGQKRTRLKVVVDNLQFLGRRPQEDGQAGAASPVRARLAGAADGATVAAAPLAGEDEQPPF